jgi:ATP-binding cassette subfamily B multidrug efflux pump
MTQSATSQSETLLGTAREYANLRLAHDSGLIRRLWLFMLPHRPLLVSSLVLIVIINGLGLLVPLVVRNAFDARSLREIQVAGLQFLIIIFAQQGLSFAQKYSMHIVGVRIAHDLRMAAIRFLQGQRLAFFDLERTGWLVTRVTTDPEAVRDLFRFGVLNALGDALLLVGIVAMMFALNWRLTIVVLATVPFIVAMVEMVRRNARRALRTMRDRLTRLNGYLSEQADGIATVQSYGAESQARVEFAAINDGHRNASLRYTTFQGFLTSSIQLLSSLCIASIFWFVGVHIAQSEVGFGTLIAFIYYAHRFFEPLGMLGSRYTQLQSSLAGAERIFDLLDKREPDAPVDILHPAGNAEYAFEFERVGFRYRKDVSVLRDVSFSVRRGERIAVVGTTGCGKSTLMSMLLRIRDVDVGAVRLGGIDVRAFSREQLRSQFSVVPQDPFLFSGTLAANVAAGDQSVDEARVEAALRKVGADDLIDRRRGGVYASVKARGANFSVGERQLVAFARALYRDAPIVVLDEATASVDNRTDTLLQRALSRLLVGRTALIIAHRLSTIHSADRILVLHDGEIAESGNHADLMAKKGIYAKAYDLQKTRQTLTETISSAATTRNAVPP